MNRRTKNLGPCSVPTCGEPAWALGWCHRHYGYQFAHDGDPGPERVCLGCGAPLVHDPRKVGRPKSYCGPACRPLCAREGCPNRAAENGLCKSHGTAHRRATTTIICSNPGCDHIADGARGLCDPHYKDLLLSLRPRCEVDGCDNPAKSRAGGPCLSHHVKATRDPEALRAKHILRTFGITVEQYDAMLAAQGGVCAICHLPEPKRHAKSGRPFALPVDHDHTTGIVRGLLCSNCNAALGLFGDDPELVAAALAYLRSHAERDTPPTSA